MKVEKLPSGSYRVRVYLGRKDGKPVQKSITGKTRQEVIRKAGALVLPTYEDLTLEDACRQYLETRGPELSPATEGNKKRADNGNRTRPLSALFCCYSLIFHLSCLLS